MGKFSKVDPVANRRIRKFSAYKHPESYITGVPCKYSNAFPRWSWQRWGGQGNQQHVIMPSAFGYFFYIPDTNVRAFLPSIFRWTDSSMFVDMRTRDGNTWSSEFHRPDQSSNYLTQRIPQVPFHDPAINDWLPEDFVSMSWFLTDFQLDSFGPPWSQGTTPIGRWTMNPRIVYAGGVLRSFITSCYLWPLGDVNLMERSSIVPNGATTTVFYDNDEVVAWEKWAQSVLSTEAPLVYPED